MCNIHERICYCIVERECQDNIYICDYKYNRILFIEDTF